MRGNRLGLRERNVCSDFDHLLYLPRVTVTDFLSPCFFHGSRYVEKDIRRGTLKMQVPQYLDLDEAKYLVTTLYALIFVKTSATCERHRVGQ